MRRDTKEREHENYAFNTSRMMRDIVRSRSMLTVRHYLSHNFVLAWRDVQFQLLVMQTTPYISQYITQLVLLVAIIFLHFFVNCSQVNDSHGSSAFSNFLCLLSTPSVSFLMIVGTSLLVAMAMAVVLDGGWRNEASVDDDEDESDGKPNS